MSDDLDQLERQREARAAAVAAFAEGDDPLALADGLEHAANLVRDGTDPNDDTREGLFLRDYADALDVGAELHRWDASVRSAEADADRYLRAAKRRIETISIYREDALFGPLTAALSTFATISEPSAIRGALATLANVPVPTRLLRRRRRQERFRREPSEREVEPIIVCLFEIDGEIVGHPLVLRLNRVYDLGVRIRATDWPEWAKMLRLEFLSVVPLRDLDLPAFELARPTTKGARDVWSLEAKGSVVLRASGAPGAPPWRPRVAVSFIGGERTEAARVVGYTELRLRAFDGTRDQLTGRQPTDERLIAMYSQLWHLDFSDAEVQTFCRFFTAIARAAYGIQADRQFGEGRKITEAIFHDELERRLRADPSLSGRVERRTPAGGGYVDLLHDRINAELKVAEGEAATIDGAGKYMGQPTQYAGDLGAQLSILCILDREAKRAPVGVLENYVGWFIPPLHGLVDPRYPSRVAVIIVNANLPRPSDWSRRTTLWTKASRSARGRKKGR